MKRFAFIVLLVASIAHAQRWQVNDRLRQTILLDPQISPDGKSVLLIVEHANTKDNRWDTDLTLVDVAGGGQRQLTFERRGVAWPRWSPDGGRVAFLANSSAERDAKRQIWIAPMQGGDAHRVTDAPRGVQQFTWSPDGSQI